jgi:hypothetical protein
LFIPDPDPDYLPIPDPRSRGQKELDPGSGSATLMHPIADGLDNFHVITCDQQPWKVFEWVRFILRKNSIGKAIKAKEKHGKRLFSGNRSWHVTLWTDSNIKTDIASKKGNAFGKYLNAIGRYNSIKIKTEQNKKPMDLKRRIVNVL